MGAPAQTPCVYVDAGGDLAFSAECLKALAACGFPEIGFGSYSKVQKVQSAARKSLKSGWKPESGVEKEVAGLPKAQRQFLAAGESGHMATNSLFKQPGGRGDPCSNLPGCAGYDDNGAPCTVHQGKATTEGTPHYDITQQEGSTAQDNTGKNGTVSQAGVTNCVDASATIAVKGVDPDGPTGNAASAKMQGIQQKSADSLTKGDQGKGISTTGSGAGDAAKSDGSSANPAKGKAGKNGLTAAQDKAKECMKAFWKKGADKARKDFADRNRNKSAGALKSMSSAPTPNPKAQAAAAQQIANNEDRIDELEGSKKKADVAERAALQQQNSDLKDGCRSAQADYLNWYYDRGKTPPAMSGMTPPGAGGSGGGEVE